MDTLQGKVAVITGKVAVITGIPVTFHFMLLRLSKGAGQGIHV